MMAITAATGLNVYHPLRDFYQLYPIVAPTLSKVSASTPPKAFAPRAAAYILLMRRSSAGCGQVLSKVCACAGLLCTFCGCCDLASHHDFHRDVLRHVCHDRSFSAIIVPSLSWVQAQPRRAYSLSVTATTTTMTTTSTRAAAAAAGNGFLFESMTIVVVDRTPCQLKPRPGALCRSFVQESPVLAGALLGKRWGEGAD